MRNRFVFALATGIGAAALLHPTLIDTAWAKGHSAAKPYRIAFVFEGLTTFVRVGMTPCGAAQELWALLPAANSARVISALAINNVGQFGTNEGPQPEHHTMMSLASGDVMKVEGVNPMAGIYDPALYLKLDGKESDPHYEISFNEETAPLEKVDTSGFDDIPEVLDGTDPARVCSGCLSPDGPDELPHSGRVPLAMRMVFKNGETASVLYHTKYKWKYSGGSTQLKQLPVAVVVTSKERLGPTKLTIGRASQTPVTLTIPAPKDGHTIFVRVKNAPYNEIFDPSTLVPFHPDLEHFKLSYVLAPKPSANGGAYDYDYAAYRYPVLVLPGGIPPLNGDPFCTSPSRMEP